MSDNTNEILRNSVETTISEAPEIMNVVYKSFDELLNNDLTQSEQQDRIESIVKSISIIGAASGAHIALDAITKNL